MATAQKLMTAEEFFELPEPPHGGKLELVRGEVIATPPVGEEHGDVTLDLGAALKQFVKRHHLGRAMTETGFLLRREPDVVFAPDISFVRGAHMQPRRRNFREGPPTLAVEVVSPSDRDDAVQAKVLEYLAVGTERVWVVRPSTQTVTVHHPGGTARTLGIGDALSSDDAAFEVPGFSLPLAELFAG
jgi:Uma2 family endonuclease